MTPKEYQVSLLNAMESWRDASLPPDSPDQPQQYLQYRKDYLTVNQQNAMQQQVPTEAPQVMATDMVGVPGFQVSPSGWGKAWEGFDLGRGLSQLKGSTQGFLGRQFDKPEWVAASEEEKRLRDVYSQSEYDFQSATPEWLQAITPVGPDLPGWMGGGTINPNLAQEPQSRDITLDLPGTWGDLSTGELSSLGESIIPMATAIPIGAAASFAGAGPLAASGLAALAGMTPTVFGPMYERALEKGMNHEDATWDAAARTTYEVVPEMLPFLKMFGKAGKTVLGKVATVAGAEGVSEVLTEWLNIGHDAIKQGEMPDIESILRRSIKSFELGALMGGPYALPMAVGQKVMGQPQPEAFPEVTGLPATAALPDAKQSLAEKEVRIIAEKLPFGGIVNIIQGEVDRDGSAEYIPPVEDQEAQINIHIDNLIGRSDGTRSGIRKQVIEDLHHEIGGHDFVNQQLRQNPDFVADAFKANQDLILVWQKDSAYAGDKLEGRDDILFEEWVAQFPENDTRLIKRIELAIVNYLHKIIGKDATAKLVKSWDVRNITIRNMAQDYIKQVKARGATGELQEIRDLTPGQAEELKYPIDEDVRLRQSRGKIQDPSRRKFMKQAAGAVAGIAADPRMILEPAMPSAVEAPMYTGMKEVFPGSIYEFSIATDPNAGWTSSDDPADGEIDVSFTHDPNTNEVTVYEEHAVVDTFEVDDMHADAEVLEYVRDKYGRKNINDVRVQREEMERDPVTGEGGFDYWGDADENFDNMAASLIRGEKTMAGVERVERGPAYDYFDEPTTPRLPEQKALAIEKPTQKALPAPKEVKEKTDAELYVETIDEIMNIYDEDATAAEAARDGTLNDRIISYAAETPFTREELWEGVNERIEALEEDTVVRRYSRPVDIDKRVETATAKAMAPNKHVRDSDLRMDAIKEDWENNKDDLGFRRDYANFKAFEQAEWDLNYDMWIDEVQSAEVGSKPIGRLSRARKPKSETVQRDINEEKGKVNRRISALDVEDAEKEVRTKLLKRLQNVMGSPARKRGINAGDQDVFKEQAAKIVDGDIKAVEAFIRPFEEQLTGGKETAYIADRRRELRAGRLGKTDAEILKYRPKGAKHPMEGKMTYPFAMEEIDRQEKADEITSEEAEIRRLAVNNVRRIFKGKAGPTVKRTITEAVYGIGAYEDLVPWAEVYTEEQAEKMGERAEVAQAEARRTRYDPTDITANQRKELLKGKVTAEETAWINSDEMPELKTKRERLLFLRSPTEFKSETEEKELNDFRAALTERKPYDQKKEAAKREEEKEDIISKAMAEGRYEQLPPADVTKLTYYQRSVVNIEPTDWDRIRVKDDVDRETAFEVYGDAFTEQGELIDESEMELLDSIGTMPRRREAKTKTREDKLQDIKKRILLARMSDADTTRLEAQLKDTKELLKILEPLEGKKVARREYQKLTTKIKEFDDKYHDSDIKLSTLLDNITQVIDLKGNIRRALVNQISKDLLQGTEFEGIANEIQEFTQELNRTLGAETHEMEHVLNISAKEIIDGSISGVYEEARALTIPGNLIPILRAVHKIKSRFEKNIQGASPYKSIADLTSDSRFDNQNKNFKVDGIKLAEAKAVKAYRDVLKKGMASPNPTAQSLQDLYKEAAEAFYANGGAVENRINKIPKDAMPGVTEGMLIVRDTIYKEGGYDLPGGPKHPLIEAALQATNVSGGAMGKARFSKAKKKSKAYTEHFNDGFWYTITSFLWGKPVQSIRDINKSSRFGSKQGKIVAADKIADLIQRSISSTKRTKGMEMGTDMIQDVSMRSGEFYTKLSRIFALATGRAGAINAKSNTQLVDYLMGDDVKFTNKDIEKAATQLKELLESVYTYGKEATSSLKEPLDLRGAADTLVPRVWNIEYIATRKGKAAFLRSANKMLRSKSDVSVTPEEMYESVINSGGFVQGDWTNVKASATRTEKDVERDLLIGETLDGMATKEMMKAGLIIDDVQALIPRFIQKAIERTEYSRRFGKNDELLRGMIDEGVTQIRTNNTEVLKLGENPDGLMHIDEKKFTKAVWDMSRILRNQYGYDMANMATRKWLQRAANTETIIKLPFVTLASIPEFFTPMLKGDVRPDKWFVDFMAGTAWAGYKGMNGISKLLFNTHLPAMRKASKDIGGLGVISDVQLLRELGIADIQAMGDLVSTRYANPNFARGGLRAGAKGTIAGKVPKNIRAVFNMQTYMQGTLLTTMTEMQQLMALRNFQRHMGRRVQFVNKNKGKDLKGRKARLMKQFTQDLADYGIDGKIDLDTTTGQAAFNSGALRFIDQVVTRPNDATTAKAFKNPLTAPLVLFKRFITTYGNTLMTSIGNDFATKTSNVERAKQVAQVASVAMIMYGSVMFAEIIRGVLKGDLDEEDFKLMPKDFAQFMRRLDRTGLSSAPGAVAINLGFPYKRGWWDTTQSRIMNELLGPLGGDLTALGDSLISGKNNSWDRLLGQAMPAIKPLLRDKKRRKSEAGKGVNW